MDNKSKNKAEPQTANPAANMPHPPVKSYSGKWKRWVLIYLVISAVIYAGVYYFILSKQNSKPYSQPVTKTAPSPSTTQDQTANWKTYASKHGFSLKYPTTLEPSEQMPPFYSVLFNTAQATPGAPGLPTFYVSAIPTDFDNQNAEIYNFINQQGIDAFFSAKVGDTVQQQPSHNEYGNFKKLEKTLIDGQQAIVMENSNVWEYPGKDRRVFVKKNNFTYMIGTYYQTP